jgi:hypothetical protein
MMSTVRNITTEMAESMRIHCGFFSILFLALKASNTPTAKEKAT